MASKADSLWVRWIHHLYIQDADWWTYHPPISSSWAWKKICEVKDKLKNGFSGQQWLSRHSKAYTTSTGYCRLKGPEMRIEWSKWAWNRLNVPKHNIICWFLMHNRLKTRDRLQSLGVCADFECLLGGQHPESQSHIFLGINYIIVFILYGSISTEEFKKRRSSNLAAVIYEIGYCRNTFFFASNYYQRRKHIPNKAPKQPKL